MRTIWWFMVAFTIAGSIFEGQARHARLNRSEPQVSAMDGSGEPPPPPKP
jgi:hypothetical protein